MFNQQNFSAGGGLWNYCGMDSVQWSKDCNTQLAWLQQQLAKATALKQKVLIGMHIPPGIDGYAQTPIWNVGILNRFVAMINSNANTVAGLLSSHTHMDGIRLIKDSTGNKLSALLLSAPGIAPGHGNNPAFKVVDYNNGYAFTNYTNYYMNFWQTVHWQLYRFYEL